MLDVFSVFIGGVSVHLDSEGHPFLPAVLPGGELGADAVDLDENRSVLQGIPEELDGVEVQRV